MAVPLHFLLLSYLLEGLYGMTEFDRHHWEARYASGNAPIHGSPNRWLVAQAAFLDTLPANRAAPLSCLGHRLRRR